MKLVLIKIGEQLLFWFKWFWLAITSLYIFVSAVFYYAWKEFDTLSPQNQAKLSGLKNASGDEFIILAAYSIAAIIILILLFVFDKILKKKIRSYYEKDHILG